MGVGARAQSPGAQSVDGSAYTAVLGGVLSCDSLGVRNSRSMASGINSSGAASRNKSRSAPPKSAARDTQSRVGASRCAPPCLTRDSSLCTPRSGPDDAPGQQRVRTADSKASPKALLESKQRGASLYSYTNAVFGCEGAPFAPDPSQFGCEGEAFPPSESAFGFDDGFFAPDDGTQVTLDNSFEGAGDKFSSSESQQAQDGSECANERSCNTNESSEPLRWPIVAPSKRFVMLERCASMTGAPRPLFEGFLTKQGTLVRNWKRRFVE